MTSYQSVPSFIIKATYVLHPEDVEAYKKLAARFAKTASQRAGNSFLHATQDVLDSNVFHLMEGWESQQAFQEQLVSEAFQAILKEARALRVTQRSGTRFQISDVQPLEMPASYPAKRGCGS